MQNKSYHNSGGGFAWRLSHTEWARLSPLLARERTTRGRPRELDDRHAAQACLFRYHHSLAPRYRAFGWNQLPKTIGVSPATANRRFREWNKSGAWVRFWKKLNQLRNGTLKIESPRSPVKAILQELERAYAFFNARLFDNVLPLDVIITIEPSGTFLGQCRTDKAGRHWIAISTGAVASGTEETLHTILHEMVHLRNRRLGIPDCHRGYHNRHFRDAAALVGLGCKQGRLGYAQTIVGRQARIAFAKFRAGDVFTWQWGVTADAAT